MPDTRTLARSTSQRGAALIVSMVMLVVITLIGATAMSGSRLEWLMTNNSRFQTEAYLRAETALRTGRDALRAALLNGDMTFGVLLPDGAAENPADWSGLSPYPVNGGEGHYIVERLQCHRYHVDAGPPVEFSPISKEDVDPCEPAGETVVHLYRIWALGTDAKGAARILQANFYSAENDTQGVFQSGLLQTSQAEVP